jgi:drug/metabolite transporter (DMT)-like permease
VLATGGLAALGATEVTWSLLLGAALVIAGIALASREAPRAPRREPVMPHPPHGTAP